MTDVNIAIKSAITGGDYLLEKNARTMDVMVRNYMIQFQEETRTNRDYLSKELSANLTRLQELANKLQGGILDLEEFVALDAQSLINEIPFKEDVYPLRRIIGYSQYKLATGSHRFTLVGGAFGPESTVSVKVDGRPIDPNNIKSDQIYVTSFTCPFSFLASKFKINDVTRIPIEISVNKNGKQIFSYSWQALLLPIYPVRYSLVEHGQKQVADDVILEKSFECSLGPTGKEGRWEARECKFTLQDDEVFISARSGGTDGSHSHVEWIKQVTEKEVLMRVANQCHDCSRTGRGFVSYKKLVWRTADLPAVFEGMTNGKLKYGTYFAKFSDRMQSFTLELIFFNGKKEIFHRGRLSSEGVNLSIEDLSNFKRLALTIDTPAGN